MKSRFALFIRFNLSAILWSGFILLLCGLPGSEFPEVGIVSFDKLIHAFLFMVLVILSIKGFKTQHVFKTLRFHSLKIALAWAVFLSIVSEILQDFIFIERTGDMYDVLANLSGSLLGFIAFFLIYGRENTFRFS